MIRVQYILFFLVLGITGCGIPKDAFQLSATSLQDRKIQSRVFETENETKLLSAGISVLQDMDYSIDETEKNVGIITASKRVDAKNAAQIAGAFLLAAITQSAPRSYDKEQSIKVSLVTLPSKLQHHGYLVRVTFQRIVWNQHGLVTKAETLTDAKFYDGFF